MEWIALTICAAASVLLLGWVMLRCRSGFDFTDEGFHLNWISNPWNYRGSVSQFGFVYHPFYKLVGGDVALLRQINALSIFALACTLFIVLVRSICTDWAALRWSQRAGFVGTAVVLASSSLAFLDLWLPSPSYNSLALQSLIVAAIGMLLADRKLSKGSVAGWILIGIGGGFAFLAKPTTAAILGILIVGYVVAAAKVTLRGLLVSAATAVLLLIIAALAIDGSLFGFIRRLVEGLELGSRLQADPVFMVVFRGFHLGRALQLRFALILIVTLVPATLVLLAGDWARRAAALISIVLAGTSFATIIGFWSPKISYESYQPMQYLAISFGIMLASAVSPVRIYRSLSRNILALIVFFPLIPFAYAFGTNTDLWATASRAGLFWGLAGIVVGVELAAAGRSWRMLLPVAAITLLVSTVILYSSMEYPYRQTQPLRVQANAVEINREKSLLFLTDEAAAYVRGLYRLANENGFRAGDPVLDLTGVSPGSLYVIGARPLGAAWTPAGYPGSNALLTAAISQETCESIAASWILTEPDSPHSYSSGLLERFGIDMRRDYAEVGLVHSTRSFLPPKFEHRLLKPTRSLDAARLACEEAKRTDQPGQH